MIKIAAAKPEKSYGPEIFSLAAFLDRREDVRLDILPGEEFTARLQHYDLVYKKMGFSPVWNRISVPEIHDYASLSSGSLRTLKDAVKRSFSCRPVFRSFLNKAVFDRMGFSDGVPFIFRDMGVPEEFLSVPRSRAADVDLCYAGSIARSRGIDKVLARLRDLKRSILVIGEPRDGIYEQFRDVGHFTFTGRLDRRGVAEAMARCRFGLNYVPDVFPWSVQTSTKLMEYCAVGLNIVTNDYAWVRDFEAREGARFLKFDSLGELNVASMESFDYKTPEMDAYEWERVFERSGILQMIRAAVNGKPLSIGEP